ncbi:PaaI family thioesterase [Pallidibacillus thermolactis]|jgi:acyl-coenzyme A thioesterase PaaI-like protein|uniref:PaaI family thioesterase n=1 Tax=Pallidibacillus thermolactis TaxID=251051 RepID=UPI0021DB733C|nr:PaaI family thioesterase [Pallidibacillus thermolactis]MCU9602263.1 PaaI family thioesterase [Pallidibacillus thermolactis subsp. kokeshiiformis]
MKEFIEKAVQDYYGEEIAWCYGCGRLHKDGHHFRTGWLNNTNQTVTYYRPTKDQIGIPGFIYGGLIASLIDCHSMGSAALVLHRKNGHEIGDGTEPPRFVTASLHIDYLKPTPEGALLKAVGTVEEIHPKKWKVVTEMFADDIFCAKGEVIAAVMPDTFKKK